MIEIKNITKAYDKKIVLENLNLSIPSNTIFGLTGINGVGKSTLLRILAGVMKVDAGEVLFDGENIFENVKIKSQLFFLPDEPSYKEGSYNIKNLISLYETFFDFNHEVFQGFINHFNLDIKSPLRTFSKGMRRQTFLAAAIATTPKYLLMDEAFDGLDPSARLYFKRELIKLREENQATIIIASHSIRELEDICDSYALLANKKVGGTGDLNESLERYYKLQTAFKDLDKVEKAKEIKGDVKVSGHIVTIMGKDNKSEAISQLMALSPIFIDELRVSFEEMFIYEVENGGEKIG